MSDKRQDKYEIAVVGAGGGIGRQVVELALAEGHKVTAIVRNPAKLMLEHENLLIVKGDIMDLASLSGALENKDAVISAIGKNSVKKTSLYSQGNKNLLELFKNTSTQRVFFISASGLEVNPSHSILVQLVTRFILQKILKNMYADLWKMEEIVKGSDIAWTIMRPPQLTDGALTGRYRHSIDHFLPKGLKISRADLAHFILRNIANEQIVQTTVEVAY
ncbi:NAD(P)-dependent oxidoreductase [Dyadobacter sp. MSC1_007]|jgi:putative NADH-flavin reductase|uniref:NAD(P)-dependent oxidoreductase n=1 Tax=Dyadobacter sp. MSC1_007 TaxID=2909264 RepID=UPI00202FCA95|nr:NAD(P)H-binding protein [Dyadobacter sp. MSC1_007]